MNVIFPGPQMLLDRFTGLVKVLAIFVQNTSGIPHELIFPAWRFSCGSASQYSLNAFHSAQALH